MSSINLQHFVNINIQPSVASTVTGTRETVVLFTDETIPNGEKILTSYSEITDATNTNKFLSTFFSLGGLKARVIQVTTLDKASIEAEIVKLDYTQIMIASVASNDTDATGNYDLMKSIAEDLVDETNGIYGINEKIVIARAVEDDIYTTTTVESEEVTTLTPDEDEIKNFAVKYSNKIGGDAAIAAYLSQINVYKVDSVKDYMFTQELKTLIESSVDNTVYEALIGNNYNVDIDLQGVSRNCGGNCKDGDSLSNNFVRIILQQTLTERLVNLLATKIHGANGIGKIYATIVDELKYYQANGYLSSEKTWDKETLEKDGVTIIERGTALPNGYLIKVLPLTSEYISVKSAPPIYIIIADQYSIRYIEIKGEVI